VEMQVRKYLVLIGLMWFGMGCQPKILPNSAVRDTALNRDVVKFLENYRQALLSRSVDKVMELVAEDYLDDLGSKDTADDLVKEQIREKLTKMFDKVLEMRLTFFIQNIVQEGGIINAYVYYEQYLLIDLPAGKKWVNNSEVYRIRLREKSPTSETSPGPDATPISQERFEILSGI